MRVRIVTAEDLARREKAGILIHGFLCAELRHYTNPKARATGLEAAFRFPEFHRLRQNFHRLPADFNDNAPG